MCWRFWRRCEKQVFCDLAIEITRSPNRKIQVLSITVTRRICGGRAGVPALRLLKGVAASLSTVSSPSTTVPKAVYWPSRCWQCLRPRQTKNCELAECELEKITFPNESFDVVFCRSILHHVGDIDAALSRIHAVMKPGASLILSEPCADSWLLKFPRWYWSRFSSRFDKDHRALSTSWMKERLSRHGMKVTAVRKFGFVAFPLCGLSDILPLMRYMPFSCALTKGLIGFDECCARVPVVNWQSWHMIIKAERTL